MRINVHAGHNPSGKVGCGAIGLLDESFENRKVKDKVIELLRSQGHIVYDCTVENGTSANDILKKIVEKCNKNTVDLDISIHFNSCVNDLHGNGITTGTEVFIYDEKTHAKDYAKKIVDSISSLGFRNRGVKINQSLYVLRETKAPAILIECCFVDDMDDVKIYDYEKMANAIVLGINGKNNPVSKIENERKEFSIPRLKGYKGFSIVDGLKQFGYPSSFSYREKVWKALGKCSRYKGTIQQNTTLLNILKSR